MRPEPDMKIGYNTNGFAHHRIDDAIEILAEIGYASVAITLDHHALNPYGNDVDGKQRRVAGLLERHGLSCVIETGARYLLDPRKKHWPTLLEASLAERERRRDFLIRAMDIGRSLHAEVVSFWSGVCPAGVPDDEAMSRLVDECRRLADEADRRQVRIAFEPEPGMFIDRMEKFAELHAKVDHPRFGLTLDVGHVHCLADVAIGDHLAAWAPRLFNVHLEDMKRGVHEHLMFGEGEIDIPGVIGDLKRIGYTGGVHVELSRQSHAAVETARSAYAYLAKLVRCE